MENQDRKIASLLAGIGISWMDLTDKKKELARKVYAIASAKLEKLDELSSQIDEQKFSKLSLAEEIGINRKTLGTNNPEISAFIDLLVKKGQAYWGASNTRKRNVDEETEELKRQLNLLHLRDYELIRKDQELRELQKEFNALKKQLKDKKNALEELENKYNELRFQPENKPVRLGLPKKKIDN